MRKMFGFPPQAAFFLRLAIAFGFLFFSSGCAWTSPNYLSTDIADSPSSVYIPQTPLLLPAAPAPMHSLALKGQVLDLAQCVNIALAQNPETRASWQAARSAAAGIGQAKSAYLPSADFTGGATRGDTVNLDSKQDTGPANVFNAEFGIHYLLFNGGARAAGLKKAEAELLNANFLHNATLRDVALRVEEAYYRLQATRELERVARQTIRQTQYHVDVARARHENGIVARSDVLKAETEKAAADLELVLAHSQIRIARGQLANAMGLQPSESFEVAELPQNPQQRQLADIKRLMVDAAANRPELRAALAKVESGRAGIKTAKALYWPEVTLNADYGRLDRTFFPDRDEWSYGLGISWPLFNGFNRKYGIRRAKSELAKTIAEHEKLLRGVELEVWIAYSQLIEAEQATKAAQAFVTSAEESARAAEGEYKNGAASIIEVTDAQTARTTANVRLVQARLDWYTAMARLKRAVGQTFASEKNSVIKGENNH